MLNVVRLVVAISIALMAMGCNQSENKTATVDPGAAPAEKLAQDNLTLSKEADSKGVSEEVLGLPYYPSSKPVVSDITGSGESSTVSSTRTTTDGVQDVIDFYMKLIVDGRSETITGQAGVESQVVAGARDGKSFMVMATKMKDANETIISVTSMTQPSESSGE